MAYRYKHVIMVGIDGAGVFFHNAKTPLIRGMFEQGAGADPALTVYPTESAQCWCTMLTGIMPEEHGLTMENIGEVEYKGKAEHPDIFALIRKAHPEAKLASFSHWSPINTGIIDDGIGVVKDTGQDDYLTERACEYVKAERPEFLFIHFDSVDDHGHGCGYGSEKYLAQLDLVDGYTARVFEAFSEAGIADDTLFIVTTDHGGINGSHGGWSDEEKYVFFVMTGKTVRKCAIPDMNVREIPAIIAYALGIPGVPDADGKDPARLFTE